jgi:hypothetical protein
LQALRKEKIEMRKWMIGVMLVVLAAGIYWRVHPKTSVLADAFIGEPNVTLWSSTAQVHESLGELHWGDSVEVLSRNGIQVKVRTAQKIEGWIESHSLLDAASWQGEKKLFQSSHTMAIQASGHTKVFTNLHLEPGRDTVRIYQFSGGVPLAVVGRKVADAPQAAGASASDSAKREDWLLVYAPPPKSADTAAANAGNVGSASGGRETPPVAGWVLARFVQLDPPEVIRDYASSSGARPIAWFVLNLAGEASDPKPQYLMAGAHGGDGQDCDFSMLRVYTWDAPRSRYETAFVQSDLCGSLPIQVSRQAGTGDPEFRFKLETKDGAKEDALYRMRQTTVRRVRDAQPEKKKHR